jgi:hypothetical protein
VSDNEEAADIWRCSGRRPRSEWLEATKVKVKEDLGKFIPEDLCKGTAINKMILVLIVIQAERTLRSTGREGSNASTERESVK